MIGGDRESPTHIQRTRDPNVEPIEANHTYLLMMVWNDITKKFVAPTAGVYELVGGRAASMLKDAQVQR